MIALAFVFDRNVIVASLLVAVIVLSEALHPDHKRGEGSKS